jgi:hypothetical protein
MLSGRVDRLRRRLNSPVPLLGSYLRRRALNALVADGSAGAAGAVAQAVVLSGAGSDWQRQLLAALDRVHDPDWHDATCAVWAESRHPPLAGLLLRRGRIATSPPWLRVLTALKLRQRSALAPLSVEGVHALLDATQDAESEVAGEAWAALREVRDPPALDVIAERWAETRAPGYLEPLALARPPRPRWPWLLVALKLGRVELAARVGPDEVRLLLEACGDADAEIAAHARAALGQLTDPAARDALIQRVLEADDPLARDVALSAGYVPLEPERQALSLFLTGQWSAYEQLDFEHALLRAA